MATAYKFIHTPSPWFNHRLEELYTQVSLERDSIQADGPDAVQREALDATLEAIEALDIALNNAGWGPHMKGAL